jgi:hypothetical protein
VVKLLEAADNPLKILEEDSSSILEIIGEDNHDCIKVFKYIVTSCNTTPNNATQSSKTQNRTPST